MAKHYVPLCCLLMTLLLPDPGLAQHYSERPEFIKANSNWMLYNPGANGQHINLNTNPPGVVSNTGYYGESAAVMSDTATEELLFYSNGEKCWNKNFQLMPNGDGLLGGESANQSAIAVPVLDSPGKFYLFTLKASDYGPDFDSSLHYSIVDMSREGGLGDIDPTRKNILLDADPLQEAMIAVPGNNCDVWLLVHPRHDTIFKAYHITREGIDPNPVISSPGSMINGQMLAFEDGNISISPDRSKLCIASFSYTCMLAGLMPNHGGVLIAEFDPGSGRVSGGIVLHDSMAAYSSCFSPDNSKLYVQGLIVNAQGKWDDSSGTTEIVQYDLSNYTQTAMLSSEYTVHTYPQGTQFHSLRRWKDTIIASGDLPYIAAPNLAGAACNFRAGPFISGASTSGIATLGTESVYPLPADSQFTKVLDTTVCDMLTLQVPSDATDYHWDNNSTASTREISGSGAFWLAYKRGCHFAVDTFIVNKADLNPVITIDRYTLGTGQRYSTYQWMLNDSVIPGADDSTYTVLENGVYQVIVSDENGCIDTSDTYTIDNVDIRSTGDLRNQVSIYPNPGSEVLHIDAPIRIEVAIFTVEGRLMKSEAYKNPINISELAKGLYLLQITDEKGKWIKTEKFVKAP